MEERTYQIHLKLTEPEAVAVARLARVEYRDLRTQAHFLLHSKLIDLGMLAASKPEPLNPASEACQA